jgi:C1A family cysteine protease
MNKFIFVLTFLCLTSSFALALKVDIPEGYQAPIQHKILESFMDHPSKELFKIYHHVYDKTHEYPLNSEEGIRRYRNFQENLKFIKAENLVEEHTYKLGLTPFSDLSNKEYREQMLMKTESFQKAQDSFAKNSISSEDFFDKNADSTEDDVKTNSLGKWSTIDWSSKFGWARDQGNCGSCWSFSMAGAVEAVRNAAGQGLTKLSTQQMVDCNAMCKGCEGGWPESAALYIKQTGLVSEEAYSYKGTTNTCNLNTVNTATKYKIRDYASCFENACPLDKWYASLAKGPMVVVMDAGSSTFQNYILGVLNLSGKCSTKNHAVTAMAWDYKYFSSDAYVKVRNSWGLFWGEGGNFRIYVNSDANYNTCYITGYGVLPIA